jgi:predicted Ser/Thr protein kinase
MQPMEPPMNFASVICLGIPALLLLALIIYGCVVGARAFQAARKVGGEHAEALRALALNLWEPVVGTPLVLLTMSVASQFRADLGALPSALIVWPMLALLIPARSYWMAHPTYRAAVRRTLWLGAARLAANMASFSALGPLGSEGLPQALAVVALFVFPLTSAILLWHTITWARNQIDRPLAPPAPPVAPLAPAPPPAPTVTSARPGAAPVGAIPAPQILAPSHAAPCPHCRALVVSDAQVCGQCGLIFASRIPAELRDTPRFTVLRPLGEGGMGHIFLARDRAVGDRCVIKVAASDDARDCLAREAHILRDLQHPGVVSLLGWYPEHPLPFVALGYLTGRSFEDLLAGGALPADLVARYALQVSETLDYLAARQHPIVHCDIKPGNLFLTSDGRVVLLDFGSALEEGIDGAEVERYGTPGYAAPEQYRSAPSPRSDVYGLAATCYHLATGDDPSGHPLRFPELGRLPAGLTELLGWALSNDPAQRPGPHELRAALARVAAGGLERPRYAA